MIEDRRKGPPNHRLDSWKEIGAYFGRDERTVKRWEKVRGLPIRRLPGARGGVYAFTDDLERWMEERHSGNPKPSAKAPPTSEADPPHDSVPADAEIVEAAESSGNLASIARDPAGRDDVVVGRTRSTWLLQVSLAAVLGLTTAAIVLVSRKHVLASHTGASTGSDLKAATIHKPDPKAKELYLQGRYFWNKRTPADLNKALDYFHQAIAIDPNYACAYVGLADSYNLLREYALMPEGEAYPKAIAAAKKAIELNNSLAEAHNSLAFGTFYWLFDAAGAEWEFRRALQLNPNYSLAHHWYATFLMTLGRNQEALEQIEIAQQLDSSSTSTLADKGLILYHAGRVDEAVQLLKQLSQTEPSFLSPHRYLAAIYFATQKCPECLVEARQTALLSKDDVGLGIVDAAARGYHRGGPHSMLQAILQEQKKDYAEGKVSAYRLAQTYSFLGMQQEAIAYLRIAREHRDPSLCGILIDFPLLKLQGDPSYRDLISQIGLPAQAGS